MPAPQVPAPLMLHAWHVGHDDAEQQAPLVQLPLTHCEASEHGWP